MDFLPHILSPLLLASEGLSLWPHLESASGIFCSLAWFSTFLAAAFLLLSFIGGSFADFTGDVSTDGSMGFFSMQSILGFLLGLGWGGFLSMEMGASVLVATFVGLVVGGMMFAIIVGVMRMLTRLQVSGNLDIATLEGLKGTVYVTLPPHGESGGQVQISHPNSLITIAAIQMGDTPLAAQTPVVVVEASSQHLIVKSL